MPQLPEGYSVVSEPQGKGRIYWIPFKEGKRPVTEKEYKEYQAKENDPLYQLADAGMATAGAMAMTGGAAAGGMPGAKVLGLLGRAAANPALVGGGRAAFGVATGESLPQAAMKGAEAAAYTKLGKSMASRAMPASAPAATAVKAAAPSAPAVAQTTAPAAQSIQALAREIAARNPKVGEKIWILLDEAGRPVRALTPDQAGAAKRAGQATTWVRNLWSGTR